MRTSLYYVLQYFPHMWKKVNTWIPEVPTLSTVTFVPTTRRAPAQLNGGASCSWCSLAVGLRNSFTLHAWWWRSGFKRNCSVPHRNVRQRSLRGGGAPTRSQHSSLWYPTWNVVVFQYPWRLNDTTPKRERVTFVTYMQSNPNSMLHFTLEWPLIYLQKRN